MGQFNNIRLVLTRSMWARALLLASLLVLVLFLSISLRRSELARLPSFKHDVQAVQENEQGPTNSTLGVCLLCGANRTLQLTCDFEFQTILALSTGTPWRQEGINAAALATGLNITIPHQPVWSEEFVNALQHFGPPGPSRPNRGSALAWLAHIDLLKFVIQTGMGSALILEDDVDWGLKIKVAAGKRRVVATG